MTDVVMPQMGESIVEGTLTKWLKKAGDHVERDEPLFEISTDKVDTEIPSPAAGTLSEILVEEGKTVGINTVVAKIEEAAMARAPRLQPASRLPRRTSAAAPAAAARLPRFRARSACGCGSTCRAPAPAAQPAAPAPRLRTARRSGRAAVSAGPQDGA